MELNRQVINLVNSESDDEESREEQSDDEDERLVDTAGRDFASPISGRTEATTNQVQSCLQWIESVVGAAGLCDQGLDAIRDGRLLCQLINVLRPGLVDSISNSHLAFAQRSNIQPFLSASETLGVPSAQLFEVADLFESKHSRRVVHCIDSLRQTAARTSNAQEEAPESGKSATDSGSESSAQGFEGSAEDSATVSVGGSEDPFKELMALVAPSSGGGLAPAPAPPTTGDGSAGEGDDPYETIKAMYGD